jgi:hypothetical protein
MRYPSRRIGGNNCAVLNIILVWMRLQLLRGDPDALDTPASAASVGRKKAHM